MPETQNQVSVFVEWVGMDANKETCPTKRILFSVWQNAADLYSKAVGELSRQIGTLPKQDYEKLKQKAERARQHSLDAQADLEAHIREHGCDGNDGEVAA
jgi:hypothetical protein